MVRMSEESKSRPGRLVACCCCSSGPSAAAVDTQKADLASPKNRSGVMHAHRQPEQQQQRDVREANPLPVADIDSTVDDQDDHDRAMRK
uniref:Putative secreted protein n=1 Tax=Anopheles triannulatus TaxID=58253 RepID=A0A2M4B7I9_9DIPT